MVDGSRPIDGAAPRKDVARATLRKAAEGTPEGAPARGTAESGEPASVAESVGAAKQLLANAGAEVSRADRARIAELKAAIADGTYKVDPRALADRLLDDAQSEQSELEEPM